MVVNLAAWTAVDAAEKQEAEATLVNGAGPAYLAQACGRTGARMIQLSTDYVFPGTATEPYPEGAPTDPVNAYGRSKLAGEVAVRGALPDRGYVVRTAWLYGAHGANFVTTMARLAQSQPTLAVVDDQHGQPTWTRDVADTLIALISSGAPAGVYHATSSGQTTWWDLARAVFEELGLDPDRVRRTDSSSFARPAPRPSYSVLGHAAFETAGLAPIRALAGGAARRRTLRAGSVPAEFGVEPRRLIERRQNPRLGGLCQQREVGVLGREQGSQWPSVAARRRPVDGQCRIERVDAVLAAGRIRGRAQIHDTGVVFQGHEAVTEALGEVHRTSVLVVENHRIPLAVGR